MNVEDLLRDVLELVSLPQACWKLQQLTQDPDHDREDLVDVISLDPALTARLLRIVNSAFYGRPGRIDRLSQALGIIGEDDLNNLVLATSAVNAMQAIVHQGVDMGVFWRHSVRCAVASRILARRYNVLHPERLFVAGLLHDVGKLVIYHQLPEQAASLDLDRGSASRLQRLDKEHRLLGFDHAQVGGALARHWRFPDSLRAAICCHHEPGLAGGFYLDAGIVHVANELVHLMDEGLDPSTVSSATLASTDPDTARLIGIEVDVLFDSIETVLEQSEEVQAIILN